MNTSAQVIFIDWDVCNAMYIRTFDYYRQSDYNDSFKQFMTRKNSKQYAKDQTIKYLNFAKKELQENNILFNVIGYSFSDGKIFLKIESNERLINFFISFLAGTSNNFLNYNETKEINFELIEIIEKKVSING